MKSVTHGVNKLLKIEESLQQDADESNLIIDEQLITIPTGLSPSPDSKHSLHDSETGVARPKLLKRSKWSHAAGAFGLMLQRNSMYFFTPLFLTIMIGAEDTGFVFLVMKITEGLTDLATPVGMFYIRERSLEGTSDSQKRYPLLHTKVLDVISLPMAVSFGLLHMPDIFDLGVYGYTLMAIIYGGCYSVYSINLRAIVTGLGSQTPEIERFTRAVVALSSSAENLGTIAMFSMAAIALYARPDNWAFTLMAISVSVLFAVGSFIRSLCSLETLHEHRAHPPRASPAPANSIGRRPSAVSAFKHDFCALKALFSHLHVAMYVMGAALSFTSNANLMPMFMSLFVVQALGVSAWQTAHGGLLQTLVALIAVAPFAALQKRFGTSMHINVVVPLAVAWAAAALSYFLTTDDGGVIQFWLVGLWYIGFGLLSSSACSFLADHVLLDSYGALDKQVDSSVLNSAFRALTKFMTAFASWLMLMLAGLYGFSS